MLACPDRPPALPDEETPARLLAARTGLITALREADGLIADAETLRRRTEALRAGLVELLRQVDGQIRDARQGGGR